MCAGGKSAEDYYKEMKVDYGPLPSLLQSKIKRGKNVLKDVPKPSGGVSQSSMLTALKSKY
jgi:hypothetical protein